MKRKSSLPSQMRTVGTKYEEGEEREDAENGYHNGGAFWRHPAKKKGVGLNGVIFFGGLIGLRSPTKTLVIPLPLPSAGNKTREIRTTCNSLLSQIERTN